MQTRALNCILKSIAIAPGGELAKTSLLAQHMTANLCQLAEEVNINSFYSVWRLSSE